VGNERDLRLVARSNKTVESIVAIPEVGCLHHRYERRAGRGLAAGENKTANDEYAATGMGRRTGHAVAQVWLDLEDAPVQTVNIRYEFHPQLVRLGILSPAPMADPLQRCEHAHGFATGFCWDVTGVTQK
jgi:hypothetical protein